MDIPTSEPMNKWGNASLWWQGDQYEVWVTTPLPDDAGMGSEGFM
ncbi:hypothetical protein ACO0K9_12200 [Undibacterium sp. Ji50W]